MQASRVWGMDAILAICVCYRWLRRKILMKIMDRRNFVIQCDMINHSRRFTHYDLANFVSLSTYLIRMPISWCMCQHHPVAHIFPPRRIMTSWHFQRRFAQVEAPYMEQMIGAGDQTHQTQHIAKPDTALHITLIRSMNLVFVVSRKILYHQRQFYYKKNIHERCVIGDTGV